VANIRTASSLATRSPFEIVITEDEAFIGIPDRRGSPACGQASPFDDPDL